MDEVAVEDGIKNLLAGIGQPAFSYRSFDEPEQSELIRKWPLMRVIMKQPDRRGASRKMADQTFVRDAAATAAASPPSDRNGNVLRTGFLENYRTAAKPTAENGSDVRSLLNRLSEDLL